MRDSAHLIRASLKPKDDLGFVDTRVLFFLGPGFDSPHLHCFAKATQCKHCNKTSSLNHGELFL